MIRTSLLVVAALLLAGCAQPPLLDSAPDDAPPTEDGGSAPTTATRATGALDVYVLDPALHPLAGANVTLTDNRTRTTDDGGLARFDDVPAGTMGLTARLDGYRPAISSAAIAADERTELQVKLLPSETAAAPVETNETYRQTFHFRGYFECSATYFIITGDCMLLIDTVTEAAGFGTPAGNTTAEEYKLDFPLDHGWTSIVGEMHWTANRPASGEQMTFALEPTEYNATGHAPKYARDEGTSPLRWVVHNGEPHPTATASADGDEPEQPNEAGGEVVRTRSYVAGQFLHRPAGTNFLGLGAAVNHEFEVVVTVFYGERAPDDFTVAQDG